MFGQVSLCGGMGSPHLAPTSRQQLGTLAEAVVVVRVECAEVGAPEDQAALVPC